MLSRIRSLLACFILMTAFTSLIFTIKVERQRHSDLASIQVPRQEARHSVGSPSSRKKRKSHETPRKNTNTAYSQRSRKTRESPRQAHDRTRPGFVPPFREQQNTKNLDRPAFHDLLGPNRTIVGDVQFLLDFAVIGFGKCGTTTMMNWLADHSEVQCFRQEIWELMYGNVDTLISLLYFDLLPGSEYKRGYKNPGEITQPHILASFRRYWPRTKLLIGVRHPVKWFESLYNFRVQNLHQQGDEMPHPNRLIGRCSVGTKNTCTDKGNFAYSLLRLGKTNKSGPRMATRLEDGIVGHYRRQWYNVSQVPYMPNPVFLFEVSQLADTNVTRASEFRRDVQDYLGLRQPLPDVPHDRPGKNVENVTEQAYKDARKIDICNDEFKPVRRDLMRVAHSNSEWLRTVFLKHELDVSFSSPAYLHEILESWSRDPCRIDAELIVPEGVLSLRNHA